MGGRDAAVSKKKMPGRNLGLAFVSYRISGKKFFVRVDAKEKEVRGW